MPGKPSKLPTWCASSTGNRIEPDASKQQGGWLFAEKPPAQWMNWWMHNVYSWVDYLNTLRASDVPATYAGNANSTVQAAIDGLDARVSAMPTPWSVSLLALQPPSSTGPTPDIWSGASGGMCFPFQAANGAVSSALFPDDMAGADHQVATATLWAPGDGEGGGRSFKNLHLTAPLKIRGTRGVFVLRVHGDLQLEAPLSFVASPFAPAHYSWAATASSVSRGTWGGAGVMNWGGLGGEPNPSSPYDQRYRTLQTTYQGYAVGSGWSGPSGALQAMLRTLPGIGGIGAAAQWLRGGGVIGGTVVAASGTMPSWSDFTPAGGVAVIYVSGDIRFGRNLATGTVGQISCAGANGTAGSSTVAGSGGGGGGAVFVICGGRLLNSAGEPITSDDTGLIVANGGNGANSNVAGGGGGGGGLVYVAARNVHPIHGMVGTFLATGGRGGTSSTAALAGQDGGPGSVVAIRAIPRLMA